MVRTVSRSDNAVVPSTLTRAALVGAALVGLGALLVALAPEASALPLANVAISPDTTEAGATGAYTFSFDTSLLWSSSGCLQITFPAALSPGYDLSGASLGTWSDSSGGGASALPVSGLTFRIQRGGNGAASPGSFSAEILGVENPQQTGLSGAFTIQTMDDSCSNAIDESTDQEVTITPTALGDLEWGAMMPATRQAGVPFTVSLTARDTYGNVKDDYAGTVTFSSTDSAAVLPAAYTYTPANAGVSLFTFDLHTVGMRTITATDSAASVSKTSTAIQVLPGNLFQFQWSGSFASKTAGSPFTLTLTAYDAYGNVKTDYAGEVTFTSTDPYPATLPAPYTFAAGDMGTRTFTLAFRLYTTGARTITATDTAAAVSSGTPGINVDAGPLASFAWSGVPAATTAGTSFGMTLRAYDQYGNLKTNFLGTVTFSSTDTGPSTVLPSPTTFTAGDAGSRTFAGIVLTQAGSRTVTATSGTVSGATPAITVNPSTLAALAWSSPPSSIVAGTPLALWVTATDAYGNVRPDYTGTVSFSSSDPSAGLPAAYTFVAGDGGTKQFTFTLVTAGTRSILATDGTRSATTPGIDVKPAAAAQLAWSSVPSSAVAGTGFGMTLSVRDVYGNVKTDFAGTVTFGSTDPYPALLPPPYTFDPLSDAGQHTFAAPSFTLYTAGSRTISAASGAISGSTPAIPVTAAAASKLAFNPGPPATCAKATACAPAIQVQALDAFGNLDTTFTGAVSLRKSSGPAGDLSGTTATASAGVASFPALAVSLSGTGFRLDAEGCATCGLLPATSSAFTVTGAVRLDFACADCQQPVDTLQGVVLSPPVRVAAVRDDGSLATEASGTLVTVAMADNPTSAILRGSLEQPLASGIATFNDLRLDVVGAGYTLGATAPGLDAGESAPFWIGRPPTSSPDCYTAIGTLSVPAPGVVANDRTWDGRTPTARLVSGPSRAASFALHSDGSFEYVALAGFEGEDSFVYQPADGSIAGQPTRACVRVVPASRSDDVPKASFLLSPASPRVGDRITFWDASTDSDGNVVAWTWDLGDGTYAEGASIQHTYRTEGPYKVTLTVRDDAGMTHSYTATVTVGKAQPPAASAPPPAKTPPPPAQPPAPKDDAPADTPPAPPPTQRPPVVREGFTVTEGATPLALSFQALEPSAKAIRWEFGDGTTATGPAATHTFKEPGTYSVTLTFQDSEGLTHTTRQTVEVTAPAGLGKSDTLRDATEGAEEQATASDIPWLLIAGLGAALVAGMVIAIVWTKAASTRRAQARAEAEAWEDAAEGAEPQAADGVPLEDLPESPNPQAYAPAAPA